MGSGAVMCPDLFIDFRAMYKLFVNLTFFLPYIFCCLIFFLSLVYFLT